MRLCNLCNLAKVARNRQKCAAMGSKPATDPLPSGDNSSRSEEDGEWEPAAGFSYEDEQEGPRRRGRKKVTNS